MKKSISLFCSLLFIVPLTMAQDFLGYSSGNYTGVNGVFSNPANIADSRYRWDVNLLGINAFAGNNNASFGIKDLGGSMDSDSLINRFFPENGKPTVGTGLAVVNGPSFFFNLDSKSAIAFTSQAHALVNAFDLDNKLVNQLLDEDDISDLPFTIASSENMVINQNAYAAFGLSYARVIRDEGKHFIKGGVTLKYLSGLANSSVNIDNLHATVDEDTQENTYLNDASGSIAIGFGGADFSDFNTDDLMKFENTGFGMDIGLVYEFRPKHESFRLSFDSTAVRRDLNKYKLKVGLSILNIGGVKYNRDMSRSGDYSIHIPNDQYFDLSALEDSDLSDLSSVLDDYPEFFTANNDQESSYRVSLPTTFQLFLDYHLHRGIYVSLNTQMSMVSTSGKPFNSRYYNSAVLTPRFENSRFGFYLPISYNSITDLNAGIGLRFAYLYLGSGSLLTALARSKQADFYIGVRFGGLQINREKKHKKQQDK